ncbi:MAG: amidohydrolase family protein, partial [Planctomycetes bacterium]|nr:amidohydrolase family protein [Planctomycetota bacterium]
DAALPQAPRVIAHPVIRGAGFEYGGDDYPGSKMGAIALMRQSFLDAAWMNGGGSAGGAMDAGRVFAPGLSSLKDGGAWVFEAAEPLDAWRFAKVIAEMRPGEKVIAVGTGEEYQRLAALKGSGVSVVSPLAFPKRPRVGTAAERDAVGLNALMEWEQAPTNLRRLEAEGLKPSVTMSRLPRGADFMDNLRLAVGAGLDKDAALSMLTTRPADLIGAAGKVGRIAPGHRANLLVTKGGFFDNDRVVRDVWVDGVRYEVTAPTPALSKALEGRWALTLTGDNAAGDAVLVVSDKGEVSIERPGDGTKPDAAKPDPVKAEAKADAKPEGEKKPEQPKPKVTKARSSTRVENRLDFLIDAAALSAATIKPEPDAKPEAKPDAEKPDAKNEPKPAAFVSLVLDAGALRGKVEVIGGGEIKAAGAALPADAQAKDEKNDEQKDKKQDPALVDIPETLTLPFGAYGLAALPAQDTVLITNATIWTNGPQGVIEGGSILISGGKIAAVGKSIAPDAGTGAVRTIDAKGLHVTAGIIDCHSHTGIAGGVNEGTQSCTSEVRIFDVINPDDVDWYRQLAGGVTGANQLHGSANAMGGQNSVVKLRWGCETPDDMRVKGAIPGIKFALGENVKQANWGERFATRYPQTRMGVETFMRDRFLSAKRYAESWKMWNTLPAGEKSKTTPPLRDLELDALAEILAGERLIHCHSYRQDEILMLCRMADEFGFRVGTFQHVLEGYKVADAIKKSAIGASSFSDWWAYKWEVYDAIPSNGSIMHEQGVVVSFNSDSNELARRMNAEAGKAVKYGGVAPQEALKFVTLNPARQLKIDAMTGSIEAGKDADIAVWSGDPLSPTTRCVRTFVDGRELFSLEKDAEHRAKIASERARIIAKLTAEGGKREGPARGGLGG